MGERDQYFLGHASVEQGRPPQPAEELAGESAWLFDQIGVRPGARVLEVGCGPQGCLELLSERVGPDGSVVGVEIGEEAVDLARRFLEEQRITNAELTHGDAKSAAVPYESFDLATARLVLVNIPEPEALVAEMVALARSGGVLPCTRPTGALTSATPTGRMGPPDGGARGAYAAANGIDLFVGRRLPRMLAWPALPTSASSR